MGLCLHTEDDAEVQVPLGATLVTWPTLPDGSRKGPFCKSVLEEGNLMRCCPLFTGWNRSTEAALAPFTQLTKGRGIYRARLKEALWLRARQPSFQLGLGPPGCMSWAGPLPAPAFPIRGAWAGPSQGLSLPRSSRHRKTWQAPHHPHPGRQVLHLQLEPGQLR